MRSILTQVIGDPSLTYKRLDGYDNANYLVETEGDKLIVKSYVYRAEQEAQVVAESDILDHLRAAGGDRYPRPIAFDDGSLVKQVEIDGTASLMRKLSFLDGTFLGDAEATPALYASLGAFLAEMDIALQETDSYVIRARQSPWDLQYLELNRRYIDDVVEASDRKVVQYFFDQYDHHVRPHYQDLRRQIIHNDANEWNVLVQDGKVSGIIDFGDVAHSFLISELAIAITYSIYDKDDPLDWAVIILKAYHEVLPLQEVEVDVLYYLIAARLCTSICNSAHAAIASPDNTYASVSEQHALRLLHKWVAINPRHASNTFRQAIGLEAPPVPSIDAAIARRHEHVSASLSLSYKLPIHMVGGVFQYMYGADGATFLDAYNNIPHVGHCHPTVTSAAYEQMLHLNTNTRYVYDQLADYADHLLSKFTASLSKVFFVNSGSAASDLAIRLAKAHTGHNDIMVMELGYHGNTQTSIEISDYKFNNPKGEGQKDHIVKTPIPNTYNGRYTKDMDSPGVQYGRDAVAQVAGHGRPLAAFIAEPVVGCAGQVPLAPQYLQTVYPAIRAQGGLCISDEVQTGFGRLGDHFWGFEAHGVVPDIVVLGKPIANGHPMGAVVCTDEVARSFERGVEFFSSFGGNPVSCAIASAVLDVIETEDLQANAREVGHYYRELLRGLMTTYPCIGDVRGMGLFIGIEIVEPDSKKPDTNLASHIKNTLRERHILISTDGLHDNVIKSKPPLCFTKDNARQVVDAIEEVLRERTGN